MSSKTNISSVLTMALAFSVTVFGADGSGAAAQDRIPGEIFPQSAAQPAAAAEPALLARPAPEASAPDQPAAQDLANQPSPSRSTLVALVAAQPVADLPRELECLAGAIYFEAKSETLDGQLAVGRVIVNRARSGRFPTSYCGVVFQHAQFSFVRGKAMPTINRASRGWKTAASIAQIAHEGLWNSAAEGALYFHAARVSPGWNLTRIARVDSHVFYR